SAIASVAHPGSGSGLADTGGAGGGQPSGFAVFPATLRRRTRSRSDVSRRRVMFPNAKVLSLVVCLALFPVSAARSQPSQAKAKDVLGKGNPIRTDLYGDPLPAGARVRLGTDRLRSSVDVRWPFRFDDKDEFSISPDGTMVAIPAPDR